MFSQKKNVEHNIRKVDLGVFVLLDFSLHILMKT